MDWCKDCASYCAGRHWILHHVIHPNAPHGITNYHTHGLVRYYGHMDFQIVCHITPALAKDMLNTMAKRVQSGERFFDGKIIPDLGLMDTKVCQFRETSCDVLRLIIPDPQGRFSDDPEGCDLPYSLQMDRMLEE